MPVDGLRIPINMILDEAPQYGAIPVLERAFSMSAGRDLRIVLVSQNKGQVDKLYTKDGASTIVANSSQLLVAGGDVETAQYFSQKLGKTYSRDEKTGEKGDDKVNLLGISPPFDFWSDLLLVDDLRRMKEFPFVLGGSGGIIRRSFASC
ncbi:MAG: TraM recognition domain-containing protein [Geminicoccaceae bacterium]